MVPPPGSPLIPSLTDSDLLRIRQHALGLAQPGGHDAPAAGVDRVTAVVDRLFALQGQDWRASKWAIGVRAPGLTTDDVDAAFDTGKIVRSWPLRGTVHITRAEDVGWIQGVTNARVIAGAAKRRDFLGLTERVVDQVTSVTQEALAGGRSMQRDEISAIWTAAGIDWKPNWRYHLLWWMCQTGVTTMGPVTPEAPHTSAASAVYEPRLVLASEWITAPRNLSGDEALAELAARYVIGRGAVRVQDFAWWSMLPAAQAKLGMRIAHEGGQIMQARRAGVAGAAGELWVSPDAVDAAPAIKHKNIHAWLALPAFDEHLLGYRFREPQLDSDHFEHIVPGRNGVFQATVTHDGQVTGTWKYNSAASTVEVTRLPGHSYDLQALNPEVQRWADFTQKPLGGLVAI